jgi:hypothetical protein
MIFEETADEKDEKGFCRVEESSRLNNLEHA